MTNGQPTAAHIKKTTEVHERLRACAKALIIEGYDEAIVVHAMMTDASDGMIQLFGPRHAMAALLDCYATIREALLQGAQTAATATRQ